MCSRIFRMKPTHFCIVNKLDSYLWRLTDEHINIPILKFVLKLEKSEYFNVRRDIMIHVQYMKPFYTKVSGTKLRLVFAYQYFSITKDDEVFHFIPIEGKEMVVNLNTMQVENLSEVFVFQRGNRFIRLPLYQLLLISNVHEHLMPILESASSQTPSIQLVSQQVDSEVESIIRSLEEENLARLIDNALADRNEALFYDLMMQKAKFPGDYAT